MIRNFTVINNTDLDYTNAIVHKAVAVAVNWAFEVYAFFYGDMDIIDFDDITVHITKYENEYRLIISTGQLILQELLNDWLHLVAEEQLAMAQAQRS